MARYEEIIKLEKALEAGVEPETEENSEEIVEETVETPEAPVADVVEENVEIEDKGAE